MLKHGANVDAAQDENSAKMPSKWKAFFISRGNAQYLDKDGQAGKTDRYSRPHGSND